ncbi:MAG TPA: glutathione S-transferase family protein [Xanthobacteraceae bacterium]|nr:glutathione S-transferase family protein [Xanthobacteraceae bacterium]
MGLQLVIGNKTYSSWSLRPWIGMKAAGVPFDETLLVFDSPDFKSELAKISGNGKVPVLIDGDTHVWESLAILEYLAEKFPHAGLWPVDRAARAHARSIANEMHAGFLPLRRHLPMNVQRPVETRHLTSEATADVKRIDALWSDCRTRFGTGGPFLFGTFTAADAMYAPIVSRFRTYAVEVGAASHAYMEAVLALPAWKEWETAALKEEWVAAEDEVDWPQVKRVNLP